MPSLHVRRRTVKWQVVILTRRVAFVQSGSIVHQVWFAPQHCTCGRSRCAHLRAALREQSGRPC